MSKYAIMLDELRKLACDINEEEIRSHSIITLDQGRYNRRFRLDMNHDWLNAWHAEFERILQAIAATMERGTCNITDSGPWGYPYVCSACGASFGPDVNNGEQTDAQMAYIEAEREVKRLQDENAKLRELVQDMWIGLYCPTEPTDGCPQCPFNRDGECFFEQRMRELGMDAKLEVDE